MYAAVLKAAVDNPYHPAKHSSAPLDVLLVTIGVVVLLLLVLIPAHLANEREHRNLVEHQPPPDDAAA